MTDASTGSDGDGDSRSDTERRLLWASTWAGVGAPLVTVTGVLLATLVSPEFGWTMNALSDLGNLSPDAPASTPTTRLLFNGGLLVGGLIGFGFGPALVVARRNAVELLGVGAAGLALTAMTLVGVFPLPTALHHPVSVSFYALLSVAFWIYGTGNLLAGDRRRGLVTLGLGTATIDAWVVWALTGPFFRPGIAIPEAVGAAAFGGWAVWTVRDVRARLGLRE